MDPHLRVLDHLKGGGTITFYIPTHPSPDPKDYLVEGVTMIVEGGDITYLEKTKDGIESYTGHKISFVKADDDAFDDYVEQMKKIHNSTPAPDEASSTKVRILDSKYGSDLPLHSGPGGNGPRVKPWDDDLTDDERYKLATRVANIRHWWKQIENAPTHDEAVPQLVAFLFGPEADAPQPKMKSKRISTEGILKTSKGPRSRSKERRKSVTIEEKNIVKIIEPYDHNVVWSEKKKPAELAKILDEAAKEKAEWAHQQEKGIEEKKRSKRRHRGH
ncbi:hypothetical protein ABW19_dt0201612 [Dactylella cylindrospora]|nr:hypothetical protein ABW19_dt0201612 [Dactylella cylindrospora]